MRLYTVPNEVRTIMGEYRNSSEPIYLPRHCLARGCQERIACKACMRCRRHENCPREEVER